MTRGVFARATQRAHRLLGEGALLRGAPAGSVAIEYGVVIEKGDPDRSQDNHVVRAVVASIEKSYAPRTGDLLEHPDGNFRLDRLVEDTGYSVRYIVVKV